MPGRCAPECHGAPFVIATRNRHFVLGDRHAVQAAWTVAAKYRPLPVRITQLFAAPEPWATLPAAPRRFRLARDAKMGALIVLRKAAELPTSTL